MDQSRLVKLVEPHLIRIRIPGAGQEVLRNIRIHCGIERQLLDVARAFDALRLFAGLIQGRKQHRRENRDDRNNDKKFDQGESTLFHVSFLRHIIINK